MKPNTIEYDLDNEATGPRVLIWGEVDESEVDEACPEGWRVDWETTPAPLSSTREGQRGYSHPMVRT